jgi:hypothetical protein
MSADTLQEIIPMHTAAATETSNPFVALRYGEIAPSRKIRVSYMDSSASSTGSVIFTAQVSFDKGLTWTTQATGATVNVTSTTTSGEQTLVVGPTTTPPDTGEARIWVLATLTGSGATTTYRADLLS